MPDVLELTATAFRCPMAEDLGRPVEPLAQIASRIAAEAATRARTLDLEGGFPTANFDVIRASGLLHMALPLEFGGREASMSDVAQVLYVLAKGCPSTALIFNMHLAVTGQLAHMWAIDPSGPWDSWLKIIADGEMLLGGALSETTSWNGVIFPQASAMPTEDGYLVSGKRSFCTGSSRLDLIQCTATVEEPSGERRCIYFLLEGGAPGLSFNGDWDTLGMRGSYSQGLTMRSVHVPRAAVLYEYPYGVMDLSQVWLSFLAWSFIGFASVYAGIAEAARDEVVAALAGRSRLPGTHDLTHKASNQVHVAQIDILLATMAAVREHVARRYPQGQPVGIPTIMDTAIAKQVCITHAPEAVRHAMSVLGGQSYFRKSSLERLVRDVSAGPFHPFSVDDTLEMLGKFAFGIPFLQPGGWAL